MSEQPRHIVLAGDSIFDNQPYVVDRQAVIHHLKSMTSRRVESTLIAVDGDVVQDVANQLERLPADTTHLFISAGGNDAIVASNLLAAEASSVQEALKMLSVIIDRFQLQYRAMLNDALSRVSSVTVCTIYDSVPGLDKESTTALKLFNEVILREAFAAKVDVLNLRLLCNEPNDYSGLSPIEPSEQGGKKIATLIHDVFIDSTQSISTSKVHY